MQSSVLSFFHHRDKKTDQLKHNNTPPSSQLDLDPHQNVILFSICDLKSLKLTAQSNYKAKDTFEHMEWLSKNGCRSSRCLAKECPSCYSVVYKHKHTIPKNRNQQLG